MAIISCAAIIIFKLQHHYRRIKSVLCIIYTSSFCNATLMLDIAIATVCMLPFQSQLFLCTMLIEYVTDAIVLFINELQ